MDAEVKRTGMYSQRPRMVMPGASGLLAKNWILQKAVEPPNVILKMVQKQLGFQR